jgi:DNA-binding protein Fis
MSLHDLLKRDVQKMIGGVGRNEKGNIYPLIVQEVEKSIIEITLQETKNNYFKAARMLGISRSRLYRKIKKFGIESR